MTPTINDLLPHFLTMLEEDLERIVQFRYAFNAELTEHIKSGAEDIDKSVYLRKIDDCKYTPIRMMTLVNMINATILKSLPSDFKVLSLYGEAAKVDVESVGLSPDLEMDKMYRHPKYPYSPNQIYQAADTIDEWILKNHSCFVCPTDYGKRYVIGPDIDVNEIAVNIALMSGSNDISVSEAKVLTFKDAHKFESFGIRAVVPDGAICTAEQLMSLFRVIHKTSPNQWIDKIIGMLSMFRKQIGLLMVLDWFTDESIENMTTGRLENYYQDKEYNWYDESCDDMAIA